MKYYIKQGADPKKLIMGIPLYAQSFTLIDQSNTGLDSKASGPGQAGEFTRAAGFTAFYEVRKTKNTKNVDPNRASIFKRFATWSSNNNGLWSETQAVLLDLTPTKETNGWRMMTWTWSETR